MVTQGLSLLLVSACVGLNLVPTCAFWAEDEALHQSVAHGLCVVLSDWTGSKWLGQHVTEGLAFAKETWDYTWGGDWSEADLEAAREGIYSD